jgi:hypothetical protein
LVIGGIHRVRINANDVSVLFVFAPFDQNRNGGKNPNRLASGTIGSRTGNHSNRNRNRNHNHNRNRNHNHNHNHK